MLRKKPGVLNLLEVCCAVMTGAVLLVFVIQVMSGISVGQLIWASLLLNRNVMMWIVIALLKKDGLRAG